MEALKLEGWVDTNGKLHIKDTNALPAGEVELGVWQILQSTIDPSPSQERAKNSVEVLQDLFDNIEPASPDFDPNEGGRDALKEKYNL